MPLLNPLERRFYIMAKKSALEIMVALAIWISGVIVSLAVGFALKNGVIAVPAIGNTINMLAGWVVIVLTVLGVIGALAQK
jgi:hypothetical protein